MAKDRVKKAPILPPKPSKDSGWNLIDPQIPPTISDLIIPVGGGNSDSNPMVVNQQILPPGAIPPPSLKDIQASAGGYGDNKSRRIFSGITLPPIINPTFEGSGPRISFDDFLAGMPPSEVQKVKQEYETEYEEGRKKINPKPSWRGFFRRLLGSLGAVAATTPEMDWGHLAGAIAGSAISQLPFKTFEDLRRQEEEAELQARLLQKYRPKFQLAGMADEAQDRVIRRANEYQGLMVREAVARERARSNQVREQLQFARLEIQKQLANDRWVGTQMRHEEFERKQNEIERHNRMVEDILRQRVANENQRQIFRGFSDKLGILKSTGMEISRQIAFQKERLLREAEAQAREIILARMDDPLNVGKQPYTPDEAKTIVSEIFTRLLKEDIVLQRLLREGDRVRSDMELLDADIMRFYNQLTQEQVPTTSVPSGKRQDAPLPSRTKGASGSGASPPSQPSKPKMKPN